MHEQSLEKASAEMEQDLAARAEEERLALKLKEQWQQKMKVGDWVERVGRRAIRQGRIG